MKMTTYDKAFYAKNIEPWLPSKIWDCHTHVYKKEFDPADHSGGDWMYAVANQNPEENLLDIYESCFPNKQVTATIFGMPAPQVDIEASNQYALQVMARQGYEGLALVHPSMDEAALKKATAGFSGIKVYLSFAPSYIPRGEIRIFDFLTPLMLDFCNREKQVVMLHIPRSARLKDPANIAQMLEIERNYPDLKLIVAHVGRAYCTEDIGDAFEQLKHTKNMCFDISANTSQPVFEALLENIDPARVMFGTDLPILAMRAGRITENGIYYNLVAKGQYGDLTGVPNMREVDNADELTLLMYEGIAAFIRAAHARGLVQNDIDGVFYANAACLWAR